MAATATHRITMPKEISDLLTQKAKTEKITISAAFLAIVEDALDEMSDEEDKWFSELCDERHRTSDGQYLTHDEFWKLAYEVPYNP